MIIYIIQLFIIIILGILLRTKYINKKIFLTSSFFIMGIILAFRGNNVGEDTNHFLNVFLCVKNISWKTIFTSGIDVVYNTVYNVDLSMEVGYILFNKIISIFTNNGQWILFFSSFIMCLLIAKFIYDNTNNVFISTYIFMCESIYMNSFNLMRQLLALSIGIQCYTFLKKNNYRKSILLILIAFLFHKSAIVLFVLIPLFWIKNNKKAIKYVVFFSVLINFSIPIIYKILYKFIPLYAFYLKNNYWQTSIDGRILLWFIEIIICFFIIKNNINDKESFIITSCTIIHIALQFMGLNIVMFERLSLYFSIFLIFLFPYFSRYIKGNYKIIYKLFIMAILTILFFNYASNPTRAYYFFWN